MTDSWQGSYAEAPSGGQAGLQMLRNHNRNTPTMVLLTALLMLFSTLGWAGEATEAPVPPPPSAAPGYKVGSGDLVKVAVYNEPDLTGTYLVGESGSIELPLVGTVEVRGHGVEEIASRLRQVLANGYLVDPQVSVVVERFSSRPVQVLGAVRNPGTFQLTGTTFLLDLLAQAGGIVAEKSSQEVQVKRARTGEITPVVVGLDKLVKTGEGNIEIMAGDVVYVPEGVFVFVSGQVARPGPVPWRDGITLSQAVAGSGGQLTTASIRRITILRGGSTIRVNLAKVLKGREVDPLVLAGDQIFVGESVF